VVPANNKAAAPSVVNKTLVVVVLIKVTRNLLSIW